MSYKDRAEVILPPHGTPETDPNRWPCRECRMPQLRSMLSQYGGLCLHCYASWCAKPGPRSRFTSNRNADPKGWAKALRTAEESGERLTLFQKQAWRDALLYQIRGNMEENDVF